MAVAKRLPIVLPDDWDAFRLRPQGVPVGHTLGRARGTNIPGARIRECSSMSNRYIRAEVADFRIARSDVANGADVAEVAWKVIEPMWNTLKTPYEPDERLQTVATPGQCALYALHWTISEVSNGGFHQYFYNSTGYLAPEAIAGAELLGASEYANVIRRATSIFPSKEALRDLDQRQQILEQATDEQIAFLASLDDALYALLESPKQSPDVFVGPYIEAHPEEFFRG